MRSLPHVLLTVVVVIMAYMTQDTLADCPEWQGMGSCTEGRHQPDFGDVPTALSLCSCIASMFGSILVVIPFLLWRDVRSGLRRIVTYLAIADFFTAAGYTLASFNYIRYKHHIKVDEYISACKTFSIICQIQAYISSWASLSSFWWTAILALYLYKTVTKGHMNALNKWFPLFHVLAWGSPMIVMLPLLCTGSLGYSLFSAGGWCFISNQRNTMDHPFHPSYQDYHSSLVTVIKILAGGKFVEISTYVWVITLYGMMHLNLRKKKRAASNNDDTKGFVNLLTQMERKLGAIPVAFILVRIWGTLQFVFTSIIFAFNGVDQSGCVAKPVYYALYFFACIQSIGDGAQGWCNAILYILLSPKIRMRLLGVFLNPLCRCLYDTIGLMQSETLQQKSNGGAGASSIQCNAAINAGTKDITDNKTEKESQVI